VSFRIHYFGSKYILMSRIFFIAIALSISSAALGQTHENLVDLQPKDDYKNIRVHKLDSDSLASTFLIWVKKSVKEHFHAEHTEVVQVLEGEGVMTLGDESFKIRSGDYIFIPKGTPHSVEVKHGSILKALSIQTPLFDGSDRIFVSKE